MTNLTDYTAYNASAYFWTPFRNHASAYLPNLFLGYRDGCGPHWLIILREMATSVTRYGLPGFNWSTSSRLNEALARLQKPETLTAFTTLMAQAGDEWPQVVEDFVKGRILP